MGGGGLTDISTRTPKDIQILRPSSMISKDRRLYSPQYTLMAVMTMIDVVLLPPLRCCAVICCAAAVWPPMSCTSKHTQHRTNRRSHVRVRPAPSPRDIFEHQSFHYEKKAPLNVCVQYWYQYFVHWVLMHHLLLLPVGTCNHSLTRRCSRIQIASLPTGPPQSR